MRMRSGRQRELEGWCDSDVHGAGDAEDLEERRQERERQGSGAHAGPSGRQGATPGAAAAGAAAGAAEAGARSGSGGGGGGAADVAPAASLASYLARRGSLVRPADAFRIFCGTLSLLRALHARGATLRRVRPSSLRITSNGVRGVPSAPAAPFLPDPWLRLFLYPWLRFLLYPLKLSAPCFSVAPPHLLHACHCSSNPWSSVRHHN
jgi:hypothetical protein